MNENLKEPKIVFDAENDKIIYHEYFVTFSDEGKTEEYAKVYVESLADLGLVLHSKLSTPYKSVCHENGFPKYAERKNIYPKGETQTFAVVNHNGRKIILNDDPLEKREVVFCDEREFRKSKVFSGYVFMDYELSGAHDGEPIYIAVKNVQKDFDTDGITVTHDGYFWADDLTPLDDLIPDWYDGILGETIKDDFFEGYDANEGW